MGRGKNLIKKVPENECTRPHSCIGCIIINNNNIVDDSNEETCIEGSGFCVAHPDIKYKGSFITVKGGGGLIYTRSLSNIGKEEDTSNNNALGITAVDDTNKKWKKEEAEDTCARPHSCISFWKGEAHLIHKIFVEAQGDDLRRFDKHKKEGNFMDE
jgi:hypothetical protein